MGDKLIDQPSRIRALHRAARAVTLLGRKAIVVEYGSSGKSQNACARKETTKKRGKKQGEKLLTIACD